MFDNGNIIFCSILHFCCAKVLSSLFVLLLIIFSGRGEMLCFSNTISDILEVYREFCGICWLPLCLLIGILYFPLPIVPKDFVCLMDGLFQVLALSSLSNGY